MTAGVADIWLIRTDVPDAALAGLAALLDDRERRRAGALHNAGDRRRFIAAYGSVRLILGRHLGVPAGQLRWRYGPHGKPELAGGPAGTQLSISHSGGLSALALTTGRRVGVDVQQRVPGLDVTRLAARFYPRAEASFVAAAAGPAGRADRFGRLWTRKEACVKVTGGRLVQGLKLPVGGASPVIAAAPGIAAGPGAAPAGPFLVRDIAVPPGFHAAVALAGEMPCRVRRHWWQHPAGQARPIPGGRL